MKKVCPFPVVMLFFYCASANVSLPKVFSDHMILQRNQPIPVWGWANPREKITVQFDHQAKTITAGTDGRWMVKLDAQKEGGPYQLTVNGKNTIAITDVWLGEVWVCSGQSNMEMPIAGWGEVNNYKQEIAEADYPQIRQFLVTKTISGSPADDVAGGSWQPCSPQTAGDFTAAGYFFARELYKQLHVPIGLINSTWGGTMIETWISHDALVSSDEFKTVGQHAGLDQWNLLLKQKTEDLQKKIEMLQGPYSGNPDSAEWKMTDFDESHWPKMKLPGAWESQKMGLENLDGIVWFRKIIFIADADAGKPAILKLGKIDDSDETFVNGVKVGETINQYNAIRSYSVGAGILKAGKNVIAVKVEDTRGNGGIYGDSSDMKLSIGTNNMAINGDWFFRILKAYPSNGDPNNFPSLLYNAMINPLIPYGIKGVIWYQGEANAGRAYQYQKAFPLLITDWRQHWGQGPFPFYFVQLASFGNSGGNSEQGSTWAELREAQAMTLRLPNTGMAVATDIGETRDIHPKNKQEVGRRLALVALSSTYGQPKEFSGPVYASMKIDSHKITVSFTHATSGLMVKDKYGYVKGFEIAGSDQKFHWAKAWIDGNNAVVYSEEVSNPVAIRYAWADDAPDANLYNKEGLPAAAFRTDSWKGITEGVRYILGQ